MADNPRMEMVPEKAPKVINQERWDGWRKHAEDNDEGWWPPEGLIVYYVKKDPEGYKHFLTDKGLPPKLPDPKEMVPKDAPKGLTQKRWDSVRETEDEIEAIRYYRSLDREGWEAFVASKLNGDKRDADLASLDELMELLEGAADMATAARKGTLITGDEIKFNTDPADKAMYVPQGTTYEEILTAVERKRREQEEDTAFSRVYAYRPWDGAHAAKLALKDLFGLVIGSPIKTMFGDIPPQEITITTGVNKTETVPWGKIVIPSLPGAEFYFGDQRDSDRMPVFAVNVGAKKKFKKDIEQLFDRIQYHLEHNSIYRGHALLGSKELEFLDTSKFKANQIVFSDHVTSTLDAALFGTIRNSATMKAEGLPTKKSILLYGPFGTGKSSVGMITAQVAEANGWTFLQARTGVDRVEDVLKTAKLYAPAVVFVEDIGEQASALSDSSRVSQLLETFDGIAAKDSDLIMVLTTNHVEQIHKGMLRPGRIDFALEIGALDRSGVERLIRALIDPKKLDGNVDFNLVHAAMEGFEPAFVRATADRAKIWAIHRGGGKANYTITTQDLVSAATSLHSQLELLRKASETIPSPSLEVSFRNALAGVPVLDDDDDVAYKLGTVNN
jgi:ATPase family protein associated with various cellular activities (AAA)